MSGTLEARMRERLARLAPQRLVLTDDSAAHQGHAGWREGGGTHWALLVVAETFAGRSLPARHRMVYEALGDLMDNPIHALSIRAQTPAEASAATPKG